MNTRIASVAAILTCGISLLSIACGKSGDTPESKGKETGEARNERVSSLEGVPLRGAIEKAGFVLASFREFPTSSDTEKGQAVIYQSGGKGNSGGILYLKTVAGKTAPSWHWYFEDAVPDSAYPVEINEDGMWDIRVIMKDGSSRELLQDETFTLQASLRNDWIAMNGTSSPPTHPEHAMWKCFDGRPKTTWRSSLEGREEVYLQVYAPFGVQRGILTIRTIDDSHPRECLLYSDGELIKRFRLEDKAGSQKIQIGRSILRGGEIRFAVRSTYGNAKHVAIAEFSLE